MANRPRYINPINPSRGSQESELKFAALRPGNELMLGRPRGRFRFSLYGGSEYLTCVGDRTRGTLGIDPLNFPGKRGISRVQKGSPLRGLSKTT